MNIAIIGTGMYTCGRGTDSYGTILPALYEWKRSGKAFTLSIAGHHSGGIGIVKKKISELNKLFGFEITPKYFPAGNKSDQYAYKSVIRSLGKPACAIVAVPDNLHSAIAGDCIEKGIHTLVVKPLAPTLKEAKRLIKLGEDNNVYCAVEYHKRFDKANVMLKDTIAKDSLGDLLYILVEYSQRKSIPTSHFKSWVNSTNIFQYLGVHYVDLIYYVTGAHPLRAMATGQKAYLASKGTDVYDSIQAGIEWRAPSGKKFISYIATNWIDPEATSAMSDQKIKVIGTKGRFESDQKNRGIQVVTDAGGIEEPNPYFCRPYGREGELAYSGYGIDSICRFLDDVVDIENKDVTIPELEKNRPTFRQSLIPTAILEAVAKSLDRNGAWIDVGKVSKKETL